MEYWSNIILVVGILMVLLSQVLPFLSAMGFGNLPGDIFFASSKTGMKIYFPWVTCTVVSIILTCLNYWLNKP